MVDAVEALGDISVKHIFGFGFYLVEYCHNRIMTRASWSKAEAIWLEFGFPFGFQG
jgi:hypothetical protein